MTFGRLKHSALKQIAVHNGHDWSFSHVTWNFEICMVVLGSAITLQL